MEIGVTVGKFNPPHLGHAFLVETAARQVDHLYVLVGDRADQTIPAADRAAWLADAAPGNVSVLVTPDDLPAANEPWARRTLEVLPVRPSVAFTSEPWGEEWAALMGCRHVAVDPARGTHPISATRLRSGLREHFEWLVPAARAALARRVVLVGAESTGKTTLAGALAERLGTVWVPEYGRVYWQGRRHLGDQSWSSDEFVHIADTHHAIADGLARKAGGGVVVLDTDALVTSVWHHRYLGRCHPELEQLVGRHRPDLYLVCAPDFAWVQDGTRESAGQRRSMHERTLAAVEASGVPYAVLSGTPGERLDDATELVETHVVFPTLI